MRTPEWPSAWYRWMWRRRYGADPDQLIRIGREVAVSCPYTHLGRPIEFELNDKGPNSHFMKLTITAYVYDHRYEPAMHTDILRRVKREFLACGLLKAETKSDSD